jgi:hypothetical protein
VSDFIAMIRDEHGSGVRVDRLDGWRRDRLDGGTYVFAGGESWRLAIPPEEFVQRLDRALTALNGDEA